MPTDKNATGHLHKTMEAVAGGIFLCGGRLTLAPTTSARLPTQDCGALRGNAPNCVRTARYPHTPLWSSPKMPTHPCPRL